ncbi:MAG: hypothetical protein UV70_C0007G0039 [Parcubacteria group bacterium GW2011_GWA2_43_13]|nr:MAG: hypothetical protein UV70_C0007G0039 [Parcubacteria group bacterium GW2011_GWA2_43_13]
MIEGNPRGNAFTPKVFPFFCLFYFFLDIFFHTVPNSINDANRKE